VLALKALAVVDTGLDAGDPTERLKLAVKLLLLLGVRDLTGPPAGATDDADVVNDLVRARRRACGEDPRAPIEHEERMAVLQLAVPDPGEPAAADGASLPGEDAG
jgi:hypothetical protein